jgi:hypothetical protein
VAPNLVVDGAQSIFPDKLPLNTIEEVLSLEAHIGTAKENFSAMVSLPIVSADHH